MDLGDRTEDQVIDFTFTTVDSAGAPTTLAGTPAISVYKANGTTQSTAGVTLTADFDSVTGLNHVRIDTSADAFYATANDYSVVITTGTVDGSSVVGYTVATFSIENRNRKANVTQFGGTNGTFASGRPEVNVSHFGGTAGAFVTGRPNVNVVLWQSGSPAALVNTDKVSVSVQHWGLSNITTNIVGSITSVTGNVNGSIGSLATQAKADVNAEVDTALADYDGPTKAELDAAVANVSVDEIQATALADLFNTDSGTTYASAVAGSVVKEIADNAGGSALTEAGIADAVWDELLSGHTDSGSAGEALAAAGSGADAATIADAVWDEALSGHVTAGSAGKAVADIEADAADILEDTGTTLPATLATIAGYVDTEIGTIITHLTDIKGATFSGATDSLEAIRDRGDAAWITATGFSTHSAADVWAAGTRTLTAGTNIQLPANGLANITAWTVALTGNITGNLSGSVGSLATQAKADVNAEVVDALATDTYAEPTGVPAASAALSTKIGYVYMGLRNRLDISATKKQFYDDGGAVEWEKDLSDDGTTYSESEGNAP